MGTSSKTGNLYTADTESQRSGGGTGGDDQGILEQAKDAASHVAEQAKGAAAHMVEQARDQASSEIDHRREAIAGHFGGVAKALRDTSSQLKDSKESGAAAPYLSSIADRVEQVSTYLQKTNTREMIGEVESFARREPALFIGGAFTLGLLAGRFLKSSSPQASQPQQGSLGGYRRPQLGNGMTQARDNRLPRSNYGNSSYGASSYGGSSYGSSAGALGSRGSSGASGSPSQGRTQPYGASGSSTAGHQENRPPVSASSSISAPGASSTPSASTASGSAASHSGASSGVSSGSSATSLTGGVASPSHPTTGGSAATTTPGIGGSTSGSSKSTTGTPSRGGTA